MRLRYRQSVLFLSCSAALLAVPRLAPAGQPTAGAAAAPDRLLIVAANTILADIARNVAGTTARVESMVPVGLDLHGFEPSPGSVAALAHADLVVANGAGFEPWLHKLIASAGYRGPVLEAITGVPLLHRCRDDQAQMQSDHKPDVGHTHGVDDDHEGDIDPHAWQNPAHGIRYALNIRDVLVQIAPHQQSEIERRTRLYTAQIEVLEAWMRRLFAAIPREDRRFVTSHDSLAYLAQACRLEIIPVRGLDTRQEPDARQIALLVDRMRESGIRALFFEAVSNPKLLEQLSRDTGVVLGGELYTDSVGPAGSLGDTYLGMLRENTLRIVSALE